MENVLLVILLIVAFCLIITVLLQRSEGGGLGLGGGGGGGAGGGVMSGRAAATALGKLTWFFGIAFFAVSIALTVIAAQKSGTGSVIDQFGGTVPAQAPASPLGGEGSLLPPSVTDAPLVPGRADDATTAPVSE